MKLDDIVRAVARTMIRSEIREVESEIRSIDDRAHDLRRSFEHVDDAIEILERLDPPATMTAEGRGR